MELPKSRLLARVPRYTSYPTAVQFHAGIGPSQLRAWIGALPSGAPLSLYLHIPFCAELCWFCGCHTNVANTYRPIAAYLDLIVREMESLAALVGQERPLTHMHWGGGSPTSLAPVDVRWLANEIRTRFRITPGFEFSVEIDPRTLDDERAATFGAVGVTRASLGVQELDPDVQRAIHRVQPLAVAEEAIQRLRAAGVSHFNIDLMYGLPRQTASHVAQTASTIARLSPDRLSVFGYAHVPGFKAHQRLIDAAELPDTGGRLAQYQAAHATLVGHGYEPIGLDHFARPGDPLAVAQRAGRLRRNFQGYSESPAIVLGLGASAISTLPQGYAQNASRIPAYRDRIREGGLATARGIALSDEDRLRATIIERLMCDLAADVAAIGARFGCSPDRFAHEWRAIDELSREGLCIRDGDTIRVPEAMRHAVRLVAAAFDAYRAPAGLQHALAV